MKRLLRWLAGFVVLLVAWLGVVASGWLPRPTAEELAAIEALRPEPANVSGTRNAMELLYSFDYDVPESEWAAVAAEDIARFERTPVAKVDAPSFQMLADIHWTPYPKVPNEHPALCTAWSNECLARVRTNAQAAREFVTQGERRLARGEKLAHYDHFRATFEPRMDSPIPLQVGGYIPLLLTGIALDHVDGNHARAFERLCKATADWRRLRSRTDLLVVDMVGVAQIAGAARLYSEMLAELPVEFAPPCPEVFAPLADAEIDQCAVFRSEYRLFENSLRHMPRPDLLGYLGGRQPLDGLLPDLLWNRDRSVRMVAVACGPYCGQPHRDRVARRSPEPLPAAPGCSLSHWLLDPMGCATVGNFLPAYDDYYKRVLDLDGRLRLLGTALWLRARSDQDPQAAFAARPPELDSPGHGFTLDAAAGTVRMRPYDQKRGEYWEFPFRPAPAAAQP